MQPSACRTRMSSAGGVLAAYAGPPSPGATLSKIRPPGPHQVEEAQGVSSHAA
jgi:hypothetical protein